MAGELRPRTEWRAGGREEPAPHGDPVLPPGGLVHFSLLPTPPGRPRASSSRKPSLPSDGASTSLSLIGVAEPLRGALPPKPRRPSCPRAGPCEARGLARQQRVGGLSGPQWAPSPPERYLGAFVLGGGEARTGPSWQGPWRPFPPVPPAPERGCGKMRPQPARESVSSRSGSSCPGRGAVPPRDKS